MKNIDDFDVVKLLTFKLGDQEYSLDIMSVREIRSWTRTTPLPHAPSFMKGVINLRGTVLPVMDLAERLGLPAREQTDRNVIIVVSDGDSMTGLLVDAVSDIVSRTSDDLQPPPEMGNVTANSMVSGLTLMDDRMIRVLSLSATIELDESVAA